MGDYVTELVFVFIGCLGLYTLVNLIRSDTERKLWVKGFSILLAYVCWLALGIEYVLLLLTLGGALILILRYLLRHSRPLSELWFITLAPLAVIVAALVALLFRVKVPVSTLDDAPALALALISGFLISQLLEMHFRAQSLGQWVERPEQLFFSILYTGLAIFLVPTLYSSGAGLLLLVLTVLTGQVVFLQEGQEAQVTLSRRTREITLLRNLSQSTPSDLDELLDTIYQHVTQLIKVSIFYVARSC
jgi:hypothetical protein